MADTPTTGTPSGAKRETILVVEDYQAFRDLVQLVLQEQGYRILVARDGDEAWQLFEQHSTEINLVLTDIIMPGMSGVHLVERIRTIAPKTRVIFMSAYPRSPEVQQVIAGGKVNFFEKSNKLASLCNKVREVLDERHPLLEWIRRNVSEKLFYPMPQSLRTSSDKTSDSP